jgi:mannose-6-phosphate isomerase-like protein (cupin superfamily)
MRGNKLLAGRVDLTSPATGISKFCPDFLVGNNMKDMAMTKIDRRSAVFLGAIATAAPALALTSKASAGTPEYGPLDGAELAPGVRTVELGLGYSDLPSYRGISVVDVIFQPGASVTVEAIHVDEVIFILTGSFHIRKADTEFDVSEGEFYTSAKGKFEETTNISAGQSIMRMAVLIAA